MAQIEHKTVNDSEDELLSLLDRDGGVIIEGILNEKDLNQVKSDLSPYSVSYTHLTLPTKRIV